jgi:hypothetical protein
LTEHKNLEKLITVYKDLSNDTNFVKIVPWEPGVLGRQRGGDKVKNIHIYTVDIFSGELGESSQISGEFLPIWANLVHCSAEEFADLGKFRPNRKKFARNFWGEIELRGFAHFGREK